jgi:hypothetical protein
MINVCPFCGHELDAQLVDGVCSCNHCFRVFNSTFVNNLLSAAWVVKNEPTIGLEKLKFYTKLSDDVCLFVMFFINEQSFSIDEFVKFLGKFKE